MFHERYKTQVQYISEYEVCLLLYTTSVGKYVWYQSCAKPTQRGRQFLHNELFAKKLILLLLLKPRFVIFSWEIEDLKVCNVSMSCWEKQIFRNDHLCIFYTWWNIITISIWALLQPNKMYQPSNFCAQQTELIFLF